MGAEARGAQSAVPADPAVVVGCDGSWQSELAVEAATREAARRGVVLVLLAIASDRNISGGLSQVTLREAEALEEARGVAVRAGVRAHRTDPTVRTETIVSLIDSPQLADLGERAVLLVLGGHGARGQLAFSIGSVSADLTRVMPVPVLLPTMDRPHEVAPRPAVERRPAVVVGVNGRSPDSQVLALAAEEARLRGCALVVVRALRAHEADAAERLRHAMQDAVETVADPLGVPHHVVTVERAPVEALLEHCEHDDLLVVGTRGGGRLAGLVRESVARGVLDVMPCDVLVAIPSRDNRQAARPLAQTAAPSGR